MRIGVSSLRAKFGTIGYTCGIHNDTEKRMRSFVTDAERLFADKHIAIVAHQAPQLALDVILKNQTWEQVIENDWRKTDAWQAGWGYETQE